VLAFAVRMCYLCEIRDNPFFHHLMVDENSYDQWLSGSPQENG